jgi:hypothetical protein
MPGRATQQGTIRVLFLVLFFEAWDALEATYLAMQADPRFEPKIAVLPRKLTGQAEWGQVDEALEFFRKRGLEPEALRDIEFDSAQDRLRSLAPDYVFINYPWMRNYPEPYRIENLGWTRVAYIPYFSLALVNEPGVEGVAPHLYLQQVHQQARLVFSTDLPTHQALSATDRLGRGSSGVHFVGSPKLDNLVSRTRSTNKASRRHAKSDATKLHLIWAPHHSYDENWLNFGNFADIYQQMLRWAEANPDVFVLLRPHPFLFSTMTGREIIKKKRLNRWVAAWSALPNTAIDYGDDFVAAFLSSDAMLTDGISFLAEYPLCTGRPVIFLERKNHWKLTALGKLSRKASIRIRKFGEFRSISYQLMAGSKLPDRSQAIHDLAAASLPQPGATADRVLQAVLEDWGATAPGR